MRTTKRSLVAGFALTVSTALATPALADHIYSITDAAAELAIGIDPDESMVWMNTFPVDPTGAWIDSISVAYGRAGGPSALNGLPVTILLYEDGNGGSPQDAVLRWSTTATIANGNTNLLNLYRCPAFLIQGNLVAAVLYQNTTGVFVAIGALDTTAPSFADRSYFGFASSIDAANLGAIPAGQWGTIESSGNAGNFRITAHGKTVIDDSAVSLAVEKSAQPGSVHLGWTGSQASYQVERASKPDFSDGQILATGLAATSFDDPTLEDGATWYYRVR